MVSGLAAASLGMTGVAVASCVNISGIAIGGGGADGACQASFGSFAIVIGPTGEEGSTATAGNEGFSPLNLAISVGSGSTSSAGQAVIEELPGHIGNVAFATAPGSSATSDGLFTLAGSFGGTASQVFALGAGNSALNIGSDNGVAAQGVLNNATNLFGDDNDVESENLPGTGLLGPLTPGLNVGFNILGNNNVVLAGAAVPPELGAGNGPLVVDCIITVT